MPNNNDKPKRLNPEPDVLRELYLLSGNNCAMTNCRKVIIDSNGVVIGEICHIEAALPKGARFNKKQTNEQRRDLSNLVLMCGDHHTQIDSKKNEAKWTLKKVQKLKRDHEKKFKGLDNSLEKAFESNYVDSTDLLASSSPLTYSKIKEFLPDYDLPTKYTKERATQVNDFLERMGKVPGDERDFMLGLIRRSIKLDKTSEMILVHVDDVQSTFNMGSTRVKKLTDALERYSVGSLTEDDDGYYVSVSNPSEHLFWWDIHSFCEATIHTLEEFVLHLQFGLLDNPTD